MSNKNYDPIIIALLFIPYLLFTIIEFVLGIFVLLCEIYHEQFFLHFKKYYQDKVEKWQWSQ